MLPKIQETANKDKGNSRSSSVQPKIIYKPFAQKLTFICKFCGGKSCKHENWLTYPNSAIKGLNSDWVTSNILATQRPSTRIIREFDVIQQFLDHDINAIFNLQEPGEHPFCGDGIHPQSGFSYFPEEFYDHGIYFFNFGWKDMTATSTDIVLKILKQMSFSLADGHKIAIHCHAGRGRTGLIIAAWLIYHNNMSAKEAIKLVRSKRKGSIQSKSQEEVLYKLEKEVRESRIIFHSSPKFKLEDYLFHQKKLHPLSYESEIRFIPNLVLVALERLETLLNSGICSAHDIALAFYCPNDITYFKGEWTNFHEKALKSLKEKINVGNFQVSDIDDPRYLIQGMLDYFDHFSSPAIRNQFIDTIHGQIHQQDKLTQEMKDRFFKQVDKKEFLLVERFARFFTKLLNEDETLIDDVRKAILRLCISLLLQRKKWDKLFLKRSLLKEHQGDDRVTQLNVFMLKWVENFSDHFTEWYMVSKSPLKINEKKIQEKVFRSQKSRIGAIGGSDRGTPFSAENDSSKGSPLLSKPDLIAGVETQPNQESQSNQDINKTEGAESQEGQKTLINGLRFIVSPLKKNGRNRSESPASGDFSSDFLSRDDIKQDANRVTIPIDSPEIRKVSSRLSNERNVSELQDRLSNTSLSPTKFRRSRTVLTNNRVSLIKDDEEDSGFGDVAFRKNYDKFFNNNALFNMETPRKQFMDHVTEEEDNISEFSEADKFMELIQEIDRLSEKKKAFILQRLCKPKEEKSAENLNLNNIVSTATKE